jgi:IMP dehydrogenase
MGLLEGVDADRFDDRDDLARTLDPTIEAELRSRRTGIVGKLKRTLESIHDVALSEQRREVPLGDLIPTQGKVYADELEGRRYELERGLAEPLVVIDNGGALDGIAEATLLLADGHHRVKAADRLDIETMDAYVLRVDEPVELGMARTAEQEGLGSLSDIEVVDYARHPLVETTKRLQ